MEDFKKQYIEAMIADGAIPKDESDIQPGVYNKLIDSQNKKKTIYVTFDIEGDRASGKWHNCQLDKTGFWHSDFENKWNDKEREEWLEKIKKEKEQHDKEVRERHEQVAEQAQGMWEKGKQDKNHPYLKKKKISAFGTRCLDDFLMIPMKDEAGVIWNIQQIFEDGSKRFLPGGRKKGLYQSIVKKGDSVDKLIIVEGFATGASVYDAVGYAVIVAFDAGNLKPVAETIHKKYKNATIIIGADNDQWTFREPRSKETEGLKAGDIPGDDERWSEWRNAELLYNPGREKAEQAALSIDGLVTYPRFPSSDPNKPSDFNDLFLSVGKDKVIDTIEKTAYRVEGVEAENVISMKAAAEDLVLKNIPEELTPVIVSDIQPVDGKKDKNWYEKLNWDKLPTKQQRGVINKHSGKNTKLVIENCFQGMFRLNEFTDRTWIFQPPMWENPAKFKARPVDDNDVFNMACELERLGIGFNEGRVRGAIEAIAKDYRYHPLRDMFESLEWDGKPRVKRWLIDYFGCVDQPEEYLEAVGSMWLVAGARRVFEPGTKFDHMLVLEGKQSVGKTSGLKILSTFGDEGELYCYTDSLKLKDIDKPESLHILQGKLIVEFGEMAGMDTVADESLKAWITVQIDEIVKKYKSYSTLYPRQFILAGTTNSNQWLRDATGNRRYWPVEVRRCNFTALERDKYQLWAEAIHLHKEGYKIHLSPDDPIYKMAESEQFTRLMVDPWEDDVLKRVEGMSFVTSNWVLKELGYNMQQVSTSDQKRVNDVLKSNGWEAGVNKTESGKRKRGLFNPQYRNAPKPKLTEQEEIELDF